MENFGGKMKLIFILSLFVTIEAFSGLQMLARSSHKSSFNVPQGTLFYDETPRFDDSGRIYLNSLYSAEGFNGIHMFDTKNMSNRSLYQIHAEFKTSDPLFIGPNNFLVAVYAQNKSFGVLNIDISDATYSEWLSMPDDNNTLLKDMFLVGNQVVYRTHDLKRASLGFSTWNNKLGMQLIPELNSSARSYIFSPCSSKSGAFAYKERLTTDAIFSETKPDQLVAYYPGIGKKVVLKDKDADPASKITKIYNSCSVDIYNNIYQLVETASKKVNLLKLAPSGKISFLLSDGMYDIKKIEYFNVGVNSHGELLIRATDLNGKRGIYLFNSKMQLLLNIKKGEQVQSDKGVATISHYNPNYPSFSGSPSLSDNGFSFVGYLINNEDAKDLGHALFYYKLRD
jgi:hypothetical protein